MNPKNLCFIYVILIVTFFSFMSCNDAIDSKHCINMPNAKEGAGTGEIINNVLFKQSRNYENLQEGQVITSDPFDNFFLVSFDNGATYNPVDFSKYSLLGKYAEGDCTAFFYRDVSKDAKKKKYIYTIKVISCGNCMAADVNSNWVLIPKIEEGFSVEFVIKHEQWKRK